MRWVDAFSRAAPRCPAARDRSQVAAILKLCHAAHVPVVARGAGTGLSGGALPVEGGVAVVAGSIASSRSIRCATAVVQPGVTNLAISEAAAPHGLFYAPDPSSQVACTIGGNVAENSGGVHCLKYGLTVHNLLALEVATGDGDLITFGSPTRRGAGLSTAAAAHRLRRHAGRRRRGDGPAGADAGARRAHHGGVRRRRPRGGCGRAHHGLGHRAGGPRDDGQAGAAGRRGVCRIPATRWTRQPCCSANSTACTTTSRHRSPR